jgi:glycosyltransferase involved in cell wall biosynthesis
VAPLVDVKHLSRVRKKLAHWEVVRHSYDAEGYGVHLRSIERALAHAGTVDAVITHNDLSVGAHVRRWLPRAAWVPWLHNEARMRSDEARSGISAATLVVCVSNYIKTWTTHRYKLDPELVTVALSGVDNQMFSPGDRLDVQQAPLKVMYVGRLLEDKGVDLVVDAVAELRQRAFAAEVTVLGSRWWYGDENPLEDWYAGSVIAQTFALGGTWHPHASRDATAALLREQDVVGVLSRFQEPAGLVTLEAMASGCAVVASNRGGIPELAGGAATIVPPNDLRSVVETLTAWCSDREELRRVKRRALEHAREMTWDRTVAQFLAALERRQAQ